MSTNDGQSAIRDPSLGLPREAVAEPHSEPTHPIQSNHPTHNLENRGKRRDSAAGQSFSAEQTAASRASSNNGGDRLEMSGLSSTAKMLKLWQSHTPNITSHESLITALANQVAAQRELPSTPLFYSSMLNLT